MLDGLRRKPFILLELGKEIERLWAEIFDFPEVLVRFWLQAEVLYSPRVVEGI